MSLTTGLRSNSVASAFPLPSRRATGALQSAPVLLKPLQPVHRRRLNGGHVVIQGRAHGVGAVRAAWGDDVAFSPATILETSKAAHSLHRLLLDIGTSAAAGYTKPGQYIQAKVAGDDKAGFFAIASAPDPNNAGVVELLIKEQGGAAEKLCQAAAGSEVSASAVMGKGFPIERVPPAEFPTLLLFATGSGISPIKALIESGALAARQRKDVRLYYGVRSPEHLAYAEELAQWEQRQGVTVVPVFSDDNKGYVQDVFAAAGGVQGGGAGVAAVLCGQKGMAEAVTEMLTAAGVPKGDILTNF